jgi:alginate O-acetyltransferase complex protein AlgJ
MSRSSTTSSDGYREEIPQDALVPVDPATARVGPGRALGAGVVALFLSVLVGTGLVDAVRPAPRPAPIGAEKRRDEERRRSARFVDGSLARLFESDRRSLSRVRHAVSPFYAFALLRLLREAKPAVLVGKDDWLFLRARAVPRDEPDEAIVGWAAAVLAAVDRRMAEEDIRFVVAPVPRKAVAAASRLPERIDARPALDARLVGELRRRGVPCADLLPGFREDGEGAAYLRLDTHWSPRGERLAAEEIARAAGILVSPERRTTRIRELPAVHEGGSDLLSLAGIEWRPWVERRFPDATYRPIEVVPLDGRPLGEERRERRRIVLVGTSFSAHRSLPRLLAHFAGEPVSNRAEAGEAPFRTLEKFLAGGFEGGRPEIVVMEIPMHFLFEPGGPSDAGAPLALLAPRVFTELVGFPSVQVAPSFRAERRVAGAVEWLATVPAWLVTHSADGAVCVRLRGRVRGGPITLVVDGGAGRVRYAWGSDRTELVVPVLGSRPVGVAFLAVVAEAGPAYLELHEVSLGIDREPAAGVRGDVHDPVATDGGWLQRVRFPPGSRAPAHGTLDLEIDPGSPLVQGFRVEVHPSGDGTSPQGWDVPAVVPRGRVLLDVAGLGGLGGRPLEGVTIRGSGAPPPVFVRDCGLY